MSKQNGNGRTVSESALYCDLNLQYFSTILLKLKKNCFELGFFYYTF